ncbi:MAG TPA: PHP domain-containing protein [Ignavibacteriaceae bacterium]|nr:PHP domain-containing protein [Ignavibacteriaceae bacterium]
MHLFNVHSYYTLLRGTNSIESIIENCRVNQIKSIALTDTNCMNGLILFAKAAREAKIKPIFGTQISEPGREDIYAIFLAQNLNGYAKLCQIITNRSLDNNFSLFQLLQHKQNDLIILTPSKELLEKIPVNENLYAEIRRTVRDKRKTRETFDFAKQRGIPCLPSHPVYFSRKEDFVLHKTVSAIRERSTIPNMAPGDLEEDINYFPSRKEYEKNWKSFPELLLNAERVAGRIQDDIDLSKYKFPKFENEKGIPSAKYLSVLVFEGLNRKVTNPDKRYAERLKMELEVINEMGYTDYFLVVWDIIRETKQRRILSLGRGSAANSLVSYCLDFADVDPVKHNLYFERFLNKGRSNPPDIDIDFSWKERDEVIKYIFDKYGYDKVAMICTTVTFRARSAFRETAKAFGLTDAEISKYSKYIPWTSPENLLRLSALFPESRHLHFDKEPFKTIVETASKLSHFPRHLSIHPSGIVISPDRITNYTALQYAKNKGLGLIVTQVDMYSMDDLGLIKIDLLSQRSLGVLRDTLEQISKEKE